MKNLKDKQERKVVHVEIRSSGEHHYFGSKVGAYDHLGERLGVSYNYFSQLKLPYENKEVIVREGILKTAKKGDK